MQECKQHLCVYNCVVLHILPLISITIIYIYSDLRYHTGNEHSIGITIYTDSTWPTQDLGTSQSLG